MMKFNTLTEVGPKPGGTVPGGLYEDANGTTWLVKFVPTPDHARNEVLAAKLYEAAGVRVPHLELVEHGDARFVASKMEKLHSVRLDRKLNGLMNGFVVDAWLSNWDVVGLEYDNILADREGNAVRVDLGGSLLYRAQGTPKGRMFGPMVSEVVGLLVDEVNRQSANVFRNLTTTDMTVGMMMVEGVTPETIYNLVTECEMPKVLADMINVRRSFLLESQFTKPVGGMN